MKDPEEVDSIFKTSMVKAAMDYREFFRLPGLEEHPSKDGKVYASARYAKTDGDFEELLTHKYGVNCCINKAFKDHLLETITRLFNAYKEEYYYPFEMYKSNSYEWYSKGANFIHWINTQRLKNNPPTTKPGKYDITK